MTSGVVVAEVNGKQNSGIEQSVCVPGDVYGLTTRLTVALIRVSSNSTPLLPLLNLLDIRQP